MQQFIFEKLFFFLKLKIKTRTSAPGTAHHPKQELRLKRVMDAMSANKDTIRDVTNDTIPLLP